jgi:hypothetical protein
MVTATATAGRRRRTKTVDSIVLGRGRRTGSHYKLAANSPSLAIDIESTPRFDTSKVMATCVISTPTVDRVGDLLIPIGCRLDNYRRNPAVLWNHGFGFDLPVGKSEDGEGNLAVRVAEEAVDADCYFAQSVPESMQIFALIEEGIVRAASVRETPLKSSYQRDKDLGDVLVVEEWDLEEWSWVPVGMNPDAVAKVLHRNRLADRPIAQPILKSLIAIAPELKRFGKGIDLAPEATTVTKKSYTKAILAKLTAAQLKAAKADADDESMPAVEDEEKRLKDAGSDGEPVPDDEPAEDDSANSPYGSQVLSALHSSLASAVTGLKQAMAPLENPDVKGPLTEMLSALEGQVAAVEGLHTKCYQDRPGLKMDAPGDEEAEEAMKSFLASGQLPQLQLAGWGSRLKGVVSAANLSAEQRATLKGLLGHLSHLQTQAKSHKPQPKADTTPPDGDDPVKRAEVETKLKALESQINALNSKS